MIHEVGRILLFVLSKKHGVQSPLRCLCDQLTIYDAQKNILRVFELASLVKFMYVLTNKENWTQLGPHLVSVVDISGRYHGSCVNTIVWSKSV